jgi:hypothetical protein
MKHSILFLLPTFGFVLALTSCAPEKAGKEAAATLNGQGTHYEWNDDGGAGQVKVRVNLSVQRAYVTRGARRVGW